MRAGCHPPGVRRLAAFGMAIRKSGGDPLDRKAEIGGEGPKQQEHPLFIDRRVLDAAKMDGRTVIVRLSGPHEAELRRIPLLR
jgi:hypothetical protein